MRVTPGWQPGQLRRFGGAEHLDSAVDITNFKCGNGASAELIGTLVTGFGLLYAWARATSFWGRTLPRVKRLWAQLWGKPVHHRVDATNALAIVKATASGTVYRAAVAATGALAVGAFILSFVALRDLAVIAGIRRDLAPVLPLVIDLAIGVATLALVAIGDKPARRIPNATRSAGAPATPSAITATSKRDAPIAKPASVGDDGPRQRNRVRGGKRDSQRGRPDPRTRGRAGR